jgi:hypothetical protein
MIQPATILSDALAAQTDPTSAENGRTSRASFSGLPRRYPGGRCFEESDSRFFFGRDRAVEALLLRVLSVRLLLQFAPSGVGKTSLLNAGLIPRLRARQFFPFVVRFNQTTEGVLAAVERALRDAVAEQHTAHAVIPSDAEDLWTFLAGVHSTSGYSDSTPCSESAWSTRGSTNGTHVAILSIRGAGPIYVRPTPRWRWRSNRGRSSLGV